MKAVFTSFLLCLIIVASLARAETLSGVVVGVSDGDTLTLLVEDKLRVKIRLHGIDAPESKQAFGQRAKQSLSELAYNKDARVEVVDRDRYGRTVGVVFVGDVNVNAEQVRTGMAWWYRQYAKDDTTLEALEAEARKERRGLWQDKEPVPPWEFRRARST